MDGWYLAHLSADALPAIRRGAGALLETERCHLAAAVNERWGTQLNAPGRWNISLATARRGAWPATSGSGGAIPGCVGIPPG